MKSQKFASKVSVAGVSDGQPKQMGRSKYHLAKQLALPLLSLILAAAASQPGQLARAESVIVPTAGESFSHVGPFASQKEMEDYYTVTDVTVKEVAPIVTSEMRLQLEAIRAHAFDQNRPAGTVIVIGVLPNLPGLVPGTAPTLNPPPLVPPTAPGQTPPGTTPAPRPPLPNHPASPPTAPTTSPRPSPTSPGFPFPEIGRVIADPTGVSAWIALGEKLWQVVVANKPVANVSSQRVSVLPVAQQDWAQMETWKGPALHTFAVNARNVLGATVISQSYTVAYNFGGSYEGKGQYLANVTVIPAKIDVSWGFTLNSSVEVGSVINTGTKDSPIPALTLELKWSVDSILKHKEGRDSFFIKGDGSSVQMTGQVAP